MLILGHFTRQQKIVASIPHWMLGVRCWLLDVPVLSMFGVQRSMFDFRFTPVRSAASISVTESKNILEIRSQFIHIHPPKNPIICLQ